VSVSGVESSRLGLLSKDGSVVNKRRLWHCTGDLSTAGTGCLTDAEHRRNALGNFEKSGGLQTEKKLKT